ncbi:hypothetical protein DNI29_04450 [Hymenobacter sediminis]|uniref:hypothetical protein n=1 Tax=Hymenobacter sediminis TaxID=2218621 RepID=UPI000DA6BBB9|nr:hypothetical protein [Hymenobacter sediminis]RPD50053.1 hypothetical protein DNI29_04450 [Hymenobacter sediminis]
MPITAPEKLESLALRLDRLPDLLRQELRQVVDQFAGALLDINRGYIEAGYGADGNQLNPNTYSPAYAAYKAKYGKFKQVGHVDLKLTGDFLESFDLLHLGGLRYQIVATDAKYGFLERYGELLGIRALDLDDFVATILKPELEQFIRRYFSAL